MNRISKVLITSVITNASLSLIKIIFGFIGKSGALVADGIHSASDLATDFFAILGSLFAKKPADKRHPYGHGKLEYLTSIGIGCVVITVGLSIIYKAMNERVQIPSMLVIAVCFLTIVCKYILASYILKKGYQYKNSILVASGKESKADVVSSVVVLVSSILIQFSDTVPLLKYSDMVASILVGIFIVKVGFDVLKENISAIIGEQETDEIILEEIRTILLSEQDILTIDKIVMLKYGGNHKLIAEVGMNENQTLGYTHDIIDKIEKRIITSEHRVSHATIHVNPVDMTATKY